MHIWCRVCVLRADEFVLISSPVLYLLVTECFAIQFHSNVALCFQSVLRCNSAKACGMILRKSRPTFRRISFYSRLSKCCEGIFVVLIINCRFASPKICSFLLIFETNGIFLTLSRCTMYTSHVSVHCICINLFLLCHKTLLRIAYY